MRSKTFQRIALQILIILAVFLSGNAAFASCGWVVTSTVCATDPDPHGVYCSDGDINCYCGDQLVQFSGGASYDYYFYDSTDVSRKDRCKQAGWWSNYNPGGMCWPYLLQERTWEWRPDPNNSCCGSSDVCCGKGSDCCVNNGETKTCENDRCPGNQLCSANKWGECISKPCCPLRN